MKKRIWNKVISILTAILLVVGIVPNMTVAVMAVDEIKLFIGGQQITESGCYANQDGTWTKVDGTEPAKGQFYYDAATFTLTLNQAEITHYQNVTVAEGYTYQGSVIAFSQTDDVSLKIVVSQGTSTITAGGIRVDSTTGNASLSIKGPGSLDVEPTGDNSGITIAGQKNVKLDIDGADVTANVVNQYGVYLLSRTAATTSTITVNNGSLTVDSNDTVGIYYWWNGDDIGTSSLTVSGNAVVDARKSQIMVQDRETVVPVGAGSDGNGGIVFNGKNGTVYGKVELQDNLTINEGETLTVGKDASLTVPDGKTLTNNGTITVESGGKLEGTLDGSGTITIAPTITTESLPEGKVNEKYSTSLSANGSEPITWNVTDGNLPTGLNLSTDGKITGTPTAPGDYVFTVTASNAAGSVSKELTITVKDPIYSIQNSGDISFADAIEGYTPEVKTITITNNGNQPITLDQPSSTSFDVGTLSKAELNAGETAEFTVQPKTGLLAGSYDEDIKITGTNNGKSVSTTVNVKFNVKHNAVKVERKDPICTEEGNIDYWYCEACKKYFQDEALTQEVKKEETIIKAKGHNAVKTEEKLATCTEDGNIEYWYCDVCNKYFSDAEFKNEISIDKTLIPATGHNLIKIEAKDPTVDGTGNSVYWYCQECGNYFSDAEGKNEIALEDTIIAKLPKLMTGANQEWTKGSKDGLTFKVDTDIKEFKKVLVDGKELKDTDYDIKSGSTILTLKSSFLDTLSDGKHKLCVEFTTGNVEIEFTIVNQTKEEVLETGDNTRFYLWSSIVVLSGFVLLMLKKSKQY